MTRSGPVTRLGALAGAAVIAAAIAVIVVGLGSLVRPGDARPPLEAPAAPVDDPDEPCPDPADLDAVEAAVLVTSELLVECSRVYDGRVVSYTGEVVRAVLRRGEHAWVQVNDDPYALGPGPLPGHRTALGGNSGMAVRLPGDRADVISTVGDHRAHGDIIEVVGTFDRTGDVGAPAILAERAEVVDAGEPITHDIDPVRAAVAAASSVVALAVAAVAHRDRLMTGRRGRSLRISPTGRRGRPGAAPSRPQGR